MEKLLLELENRFFQHSYISDRDWLEQTLHENFLECGKSGRLFHKADTVNSLLQCKEDRQIQIEDFQCSKISSNTWIVHYLTGSSEGEPVFRTSIWIKKHTLQLYFHQATKIAAGNNSRGYLSSPKP